MQQSRLTRYLVAESSAPSPLGLRATPTRSGRRLDWAAPEAASRPRRGEALLDECMKQGHIYTGPTNKDAYLLPVTVADRTLWPDSM